MKKILLILTLLIYSFSNAQIIYIPDDNFKDALLSANYGNDIAKDLNFNPVSIDTNNDGEIQVSEAENIAYLDVSTNYILDLTGIEYFTNLISLNCSSTNLNSLNVSNNTYLTELDCSFNQLDFLDISNNTYLRELFCSNNQLDYLDFTINTSLEMLDCSNNQLDYLDLTNNTNLESLYCAYNSLDALDISLINLFNLDCSQNSLSSLNVSNSTDLTQLTCSYNQLSNLNLSNNTSLTHFQCDGNQITSLDLSSNTNLISLDCSYNELTSLNISNGISLKYLHCTHNQLTNLDISDNTSLTNILCYNNQLTSLSTNSSELVRLLCNDNQITNLDISNSINLTSLACRDNPLTNLDISNNINLTTLWCSDDQLTNLDISNNINLTSLKCYSNQLTNLDISNNINLTSLKCYSNQLTNLDISNNINLTTLWCSYNQLTNLDTSNNINLTILGCNYNPLTNLDLSNNTNLASLFCNDTQLTNLNLSNNFNLEKLYCSNNAFTTLDLSSNPNIYEYYCHDLPNLTYLNLKNGVNSQINLYSNYFNMQNNPNLQTVCVDDINSDLAAKILSDVNHPVTFTEYCSLTPVLNNQITGFVKIDIEGNGCDNNDLSLPNLLISSDNGTESFGSFTLNNGLYQYYSNEGNFTTTANINLPSYWLTTPESYINNFTGFDNIFTADFCITPNQTINDINISLIPLGIARPGFNTQYIITYTNVGTTQLNGNLTLDFDDTKLNFLNASETIATETSNSLTFNYTNLNPFETRTINLEFNINAPTATQPVNIGDILSFTATINPISADYTPDDNIFTLNQTATGSYDPNDITCLEGNEILDTNTDKYLHYVIRFQNTGTASAINVVVKNILDNQLDWNTLQLQNTSHPTRVAIKSGNEIEFIFEDIQLPDSTNDEPNSHGFIAYKIKPKNTVNLGDIIPNKADIFFDYNEAIETNTANVEVINTLTVNNNSILDFSVFPIPTTAMLFINSKNKISKIEIYNKLGQLILQNTASTKIDVSNLSQGLYFVKVKDENGKTGIKKVVKN